MKLYTLLDCHSCHFLRHKCVFFNFPSILQRAPAFRMCQKAVHRVPRAPPTYRLRDILHHPYIRSKSHIEHRGPFQRPLRIDTPSYDSRTSSLLQVVAHVCLCQWLEFGRGLAICYYQTRTSRDSQTPTFISGRVFQVLIHFILPNASSIL